MNVPSGLLAPFPLNSNRDKTDFEDQPTDRGGSATLAGFRFSGSSLLRVRGRHFCDAKRSDAPLTQARLAWCLKTGIPLAGNGRVSAKPGDKWQAEAVA